MTSLIVLPTPHDKETSDVAIIEDWGRGLDWVKWLLGSVRARSEKLMVAQTGSTFIAWKNFTDGVLRETIGPALKSAWECAQAGDLEGLIAEDAALSADLPPELARRSIRAGAVLLKSTQHARYQAVLGRFREAVAQGRCEGHFAVVWAAVGHFFQLSLANVIAEYLHLEWDVATRDEPRPPKPAGTRGISALTGQVMRGASDEAALRVVDA